MRHNRHTAVWIGVSVALLLATLSGTASAQTYTWIGGSRTWDTSSLNWNGGAVAWPTTGTDNDALFGSTSGSTTITIQPGGVTANDLQFSGTAYTLTGGTLTLNGATPTITLAPSPQGWTAQIGSTLAGSNGFVVTSSGSGVLDLTGSNSLSGPISVSGSAVLVLNNANAVSNASSLNLGANAQLRPGGNIESGTARINNLTGAGTINANYAGTMLANVIRTLDLNTTTDGTFSGSIQDGNNQRLIAIQKSGSATLTLAGTNTFSGATAVNGGTLQLGNSAALQNSNFAGGAGALSFGSLTTATFGGLTGSSNLTLSNTAGSAVALAVGGNNNSTTYSGALSGAGGLTKSGAGTLTLSGSNSYTGVTTVAAGVLGLSGGNAIANTGTVTINNVAGATLRLNANETIGSIGVGLDGQTTSTVDVGAFTLTLSAHNATAGAIGTQLYGLTGSGGLVMNSTTGLGELNLTGGNSGIVALSNPSAGNNQMKVVLTGATSFRLGAGILGTSVTIGELTGSVNTNIEGTYGFGAGTKTLVVDQASTTTFAGKIQDGTGSRLIALTKSGTGTLILSNSNTYTQTTTVTGGVLRLDNANALPGGIGATGGISALTINGGVIGLGNGNFARGLW